MYTDGFTVSIWSGFSKRINSTKRPSDDDIEVTTNCRLKEKTNIHDPTIQIAYSSDYVTMDAWNYCSVFGRYYYIESISLAPGNIIELVLRIDVLATYKDDIVASPVFLQYSTNTTYQNRMIPDMRKVFSNKFTITKSEVNMNTFASNTLVVGIINDEVLSSSGTISYYAVTRSDFARMITGLVDPSFSTEVGRLFNDVGQYIKSIKWLPGSFGGTSKAIHVGKYILKDRNDIPIPGEMMIKENLQKTFETTINIGNATADDFAPFCEYRLYLPYIGTVPVERGMYGSSIDVQLIYDAINGTVLYLLSGPSGIVQQFTGSVGVELPFSETKSVNSTALISSVLQGAGAIGSIAVGNIGGGVIAGVAAVANGIEALKDNTQVLSGGSGSFVSDSLPRKIVLMKFVRNVESTDSANLKGKPVFKSLNFVPAGFNICENPSVVSSANENDKNTINSYMASGIYIE